MLQTTNRVHKKIKVNFQLHSSENNIKKDEFFIPYNAKYDNVYFKDKSGTHIFHHLREHWWKTYNKIWKSSYSQRKFESLQHVQTLKRELMILLDNTN